MAFAKKHLYWDISEIQSYLVIAVLFSFILSFRDWGSTVMDISLGLTNWIVSFVIVAISLIVHDLGHRLYALSIGYKSKFQISWSPVVLSLLVCFITNGSVMVFSRRRFSLNYHQTPSLGGLDF